MPHPGWHFNLIKAELFPYCAFQDAQHKCGLNTTELIEQSQQRRSKPNKQCSI